MKVSLITSFLSLCVAAQLVTAKLTDSTCCLASEVDGINAKDEHIKQFTVIDENTQETSQFGVKINNLDSLKADHAFCVQIVKEEDVNKFDFPLLDFTKLIPESLVPFQALGKIVYNRNPDNYSAETEQVTFHPGHVVRGIGFTNDPFLRGRLFSYLGTQIALINGANYMQLPINQFLNPIYNNQSDDYMQSQIHRGTVTYFTNDLQSNTPSMVDSDEDGYIEYPEPINNATKTRDRFSKFLDFYSQPRLCWNSLTAAEKQQTIAGLRFEVGKSKLLYVGKHLIDALNKVDRNLARHVAFGVGVELTKRVAENDNQTSVGIFIEDYPKADKIKTRTAAVLVVPGTNKDEAHATHGYLKKEGYYPGFVDVNLGTTDGLNITDTYLTTSSVFWDTVYVPSSTNVTMEAMASCTGLFPYEEPKMFIMSAFRHGKPIAASSQGITLLECSILICPTEKTTTWQSWMVLYLVVLNLSSKRPSKGHLFSSDIGLAFLLMMRCKKSH
ncbi:heme-dependent catalase [Backusella circina FSU 941]|nr:heme-dependent catalase [Backusella circina FSU 941]